jgi:hypothetical protein
MERETVRETVSAKNSRITTTPLTGVELKPLMNTVVLRKALSRSLLKSNPN